MLQSNTAPLPSAFQPALARREVITLSLPAHWLCAVLYGDTSYFSCEEQANFFRWLRDVREDIGHGKPITIGHIKDQEYFARYHDAAEYGVLPCMCVDVDLICEA